MNENIPAVVELLGGAAGWCAASGPATLFQLSGRLMTAAFRDSHLPPSPALPSGGAALSSLPLLTRSIDGNNY